MLVPLSTQRNLNLTIEVIIHTIKIIMSVEDDRFFEGLGERFEGFFPGMSEQIDRLEADRYGRAIQAGSKIEDLRTVGYILPANEEQTEYVVMLKTGDVMVIQPRDPHDPNSLSTFQKYFSQNEEPIPGNYSNPSTLVSKLVDNLFSYHSKLVARNNDSSQVPQVLETVDNALRVAKKLKEQRDEAKNTSAEEVIRRLNEFFRPPKPPDFPPEPPTQSPPQA